MKFNINSLRIKNVKIQYSDFLDFLYFKLNIDDIDDFNLGIKYLQI